MCESQRRGSNRSSVPNHDSVGNNTGDNNVSGGPTLPLPKGRKVVVWKGTVPSEKETCRPLPRMSSTPIALCIWTE